MAQQNNQQQNQNNNQNQDSYLQMTESIQKNHQMLMNIFKQIGLDDARKKMIAGTIFALISLFTPFILAAAAFVMALTSFTLGAHQMSQMKKGNLEQPAEKSNNKPGK